jgi:hypothetical protein
VPGVVSDVYQRVAKRRIRTLPSSDATATASERHLRVRHPARPKAVEEIGLPSDLAVVHERIPQFADVDLKLCD